MRPLTHDCSLAFVVCYRTLVTTSLVHTLSKSFTMCSIHPLHPTPLPVPYMYVQLMIHMYVLPSSFKKIMEEPANATSYQFYLTLLESNELMYSYYGYFMELPSCHQVPWSCNAGIFLLLFSQNINAYELSWFSQAHVVTTIFCVCICICVYVYMYIISYRCYSSSSWWIH